MGNSQIQSRILNFRHNIRNPLYAAKNLMELYLEDLKSPTDTYQVENEKTRRVLSKSVKLIERVLAVIRKLNELSISPQESLPKESVCVKEILERILEALSGARYLENLHIIKLIPSDLPPLRVSLIDLEEIFFNLIVNAAQATQKGGSLRIEAFWRPDRSRLVISFQDSGCGISKDALPYIFEPFYTGRSETDGAGFGLYIVKQLLERNGGQISAESKLGQGTTFTLTFPAQG